MHKHEMFIIETITNTYVGSGDVSFGTVDNLIQKDSTTSFPVFNSSSIKGALREHMEQFVSRAGTDFSEDDIKTIFGDKEDKPGFVKFYDARLLLLPLRSSQKVFYYTTSKMAITDYLDALETFGIIKDNLKDEVNSLKTLINGLDFTNIDFVIFDNTLELEIEDFEEFDKKDLNDLQKKAIKDLLSIEPENIAIFRDNTFKDICENFLPVIARNKIGADGKSENLFYEEVLPRRSKLWLIFGFDKSIDNGLKNKFENKLLSDLIQFGGNASIGYGVTKISQIATVISSSSKEG